MSQRRTRQTPRPGKRAPSAARRAAAAKNPRTGAARPRAGRKGMRADPSGIAPAAVAGIGVALALAELMPRVAPPSAAARQQLEGLDAEIAAVIAAALGAAESGAAGSASARTARPPQPAGAPTRGPSLWAHAGRMRQMGARAAPHIRGRHA